MNFFLDGIGYLLYQEVELRKEEKAKHRVKVKVRARMNERMGIIIRYFLHM